ncbi:GTP cyclohydrolase 1 type 2/Nif3 [Lactarius deliciosus]|nr:GTP cyclohydrolase 1 type 2/Nif3 [Lactarius deliciosus]
MSIARHVSKAMERIAPLALAEKWDNPLSSLTLSNPLQASLLRCAAAGISVYSPHTALDSHSSGRGGCGRLLRLSEKTTMTSLQERVKKHLGLPQVALGTDSPNPDVQSIAICAGSGGSVLLGVDADVYFTGEIMRYSPAVATGKNVILCGHTNTERGYLPVLAAKLREELTTHEGDEKDFIPEVIHISQKDRHPLDFV